MNINRLMGPREVMEIVLCEYENGNIFYQFTGLDGAPCAPVAVHRLLMRVATALTQPAQDVAVPEPITEPVPHLIPEETPYV